MSQTKDYLLIRRTFKGKEEVLRSIDGENPKDVFRYIINDYRNRYKRDIIILAEITRKFLPIKTMDGKINSYGKIDLDAQLEELLK